MIRPQLAEGQGGVLFLLDAPSDEDEIKGRPLTGSAGHLFSRALRAGGLAGSDDIPPAFERSLLGETRRLLWERRAHSFATFLPAPPCAPLTPTSLAAELTALASLLDAQRPNVLVPVGEAALWSVTGRTSIDDWRGAVRQVAPDAPIMSVVTEGQTAAWLRQLKILPTYPPDRILRQYKLLGTLIADLMKVKHEARTPFHTPLSVAIWLEPDLADLARFERDHIASADLLTLDIETALGQIVCVQVGTDDRTCLVLPFVDYRQSDRSYWRSAELELSAWRWLARVLASPIPKLGQNLAAYDCYWLLEKAGLEVRNYRHDLRLVHHILQPELPKSLSFLGAMYTAMPRWKTDHKGEYRAGTADKRDS